MSEPRPAGANLGLGGMHRDRIGNMVGSGFYLSPAAVAP